MTQTFYATYDGKVLRPDEPVALAPNTLVRIIVETDEPVGAQAGSFLRTARALNLQGPGDWSARLDEYLYGDATEQGS